MASPAAGVSNAHVNQLRPVDLWFLNHTRGFLPCSSVVIGRSVGSLFWVTGDCSSQRRRLGTVDYRRQMDSDAILLVMPCRLCRVRCTSDQWTGSVTDQWRSRTSSVAGSSGRWNQEQRSVPEDGSSLQIGYATRTTLSFPRENNTATPRAEQVLQRWG
jgi:hypothetical protein